MANFLQELCAWIAANTPTGSTTLVVGANLQEGWRELEAPDECVLVAESAGGKPQFISTDWVDKSIQILTRSITYVEARDLAFEVHSLLHGQCHTSLTSFHVNVMDAQSVPAYMGTDEERRFEFSQNYIMPYQSAPT